MSVLLLISFIISCVLIKVTYNDITCFEHTHTHSLSLTKFSSVFFEARSDLSLRRVRCISKCIFIMTSLNTALQKIVIAQPETNRQNSTSIIREGSVVFSIGHFLMSNDSDSELQVLEFLGKYLKIGRATFHNFIKIIGV